MSEELQVGAIPIPDYDGVSMGFPASRRIAGLWKTHRPDVVYIATEGPLGLSALNQARKMGIPVISGFHTNFDQYSRHYIMLKVLSPLVRPFLRRFHNRSTMTLVPTKAQADKLTQYGYDNVKVLSRGLDCERFSPRQRDTSLRAQWGADDDTPVALHVGRLAAEKNVLLLIDTLEAMRKRQPNLKAVLVGDGPQRALLEKRLPWAHFAGFQRDQALARHYASADIFLFPSLSETFGNVVTEAMASGLAVAAFDYAAAGELICEGIHGKLAAPDKPAQFIEAGVALCGDMPSARKMGRTACERVHTLGWPKIGDAFIDYLLQAQEVNDGR
ncbi:glycosyl transferase [Kushneria pakistanensis]|uniref:Glycosyl transferase n=2 Tax=Kushneria pakistanensis TaxID=1508770 RepID=A0ABQ3FEG1_9GAMM|nr:glycosyl transferase [Kushneria pakistanensis]